ncbi:MAG: hypothetical protein H8D56_24790 [Planctomycetes bacterium]|nr:hypothetical protein [Planctomycetota bacterium]
MKRCQVTLMLLSFVFAAVVYSGQSNISLQDIINIAKANFEKIQDIEFTFTEKRFHEEPGKLYKAYTTQTSWVPEKKWEMQISKIEKVGGDKIYVSSYSWDGDRFKSKTELLGDDGFPGPPVTGSGRIANTHATLREDILAAMAMKGNDYTYITRLTADYVSIEGTTSIDGHKVVVVNTDYSQGKGTSYTKYYVDLERGAIPVKREYYLRGQLRKTVKNVEVAEVKKGLFLPVRGDIYAIGNFDGKHKVVEFNVDIKSIKINQGLEKEYFDIEFERNLPVVDQISGIRYYHGVGLLPEQQVDKELFDQLIEETESAHSEANQTNETTAQNAITTDEELPNMGEDVEQENVEGADVGLKKKHSRLFVVIPVVFLVVIGSLIAKRKYVSRFH